MYVTLGIVLIFLSAVYAVYRHYREYLASASMIVRIERAFGFYENGRYLREESLYKQESRLWGTGKFSKHMLWALLFILFVFTAFSTILVIYVQ
jgi:hypothetical protein